MIKGDGKQVPYSEKNIIQFTKVFLPIILDDHIKQWTNHSTPAKLRGSESFGIIIKPLLAKKNKEDVSVSSHDRFVLTYHPPYS